MGTHPIFESDFDCLTESNDMTDEKCEVRWAPLESNPEVFNEYIKKLGVPSNWQFNDVFGFDPELLCMIPAPCVAFILLFPITDKTEKFREEEEASLAGEERPADVRWMKQTIGNACGTIGVIHALLNSPISFNDGSIISRFAAGTSGKTGEEIGAALEKNEEMANLHKSTASSSGNQTVADENTKVREHFVALVHVNGNMYELDGRKQRPICHGPTTADSFTQDAALVCKKFISLDPENQKFAAVALSDCAN